MKNQLSNQPFFLGLDIGTDSVGYAVTDEQYKLKKFRGEPLWGVHLFDPAEQCAGRRSFRTARRRTNRRQQRVLLTQEIFAHEIAAIDPDFFKRIHESALYEDDRTSSSPHLFASTNYTDAMYHRDYPTIHHLLVHLIKAEHPYDLRFLYLGVAYLMAHRGHFLIEVDKDKVNEVLEFTSIYNDFKQFFLNLETSLPWSCNDSDFEKKLKKSLGVDQKTNILMALTGVPRKECDYPYGRKAMLTLLSGGSAKLSDLFLKEEYKELGSISLSSDADVLEQTLSNIGDDAELIENLKKLFDWATLVDLMKGKTDISFAKVETYNKHQSDLKYLKAFIKKNLPSKYNEIFRLGSDNGKNYVAYSYQVSGVTNGKLPKKKASQEDFCKYILTILESYSGPDANTSEFEKMMTRLKDNTFMPKQVCSENRVIPYQIYYKELKEILERASSFFPFLTQPDSDGLTPIQKLLSIFEFRIPYFVGPLNQKSPFAWIRRKADGKILPWNFDSKVDSDASEKEFINRMTGMCSYLPGEKVLPKCSLLYQKFEVLNELNNLKLDGVKISVEDKQAIYEDLFEKVKKVTPAKIKAWMSSHGKTGAVTGIDDSIKASLSSFHAFKRLLESHALTLAQVEQIIERFTYTEDKLRAKHWLEREFPCLSNEDIQYVSKLKFKDFGRLSRTFLTELTETSSTGEDISIIRSLWETNENLMMLLSDNHDFMRQVVLRQKEYYDSTSLTLSERLNQMYIPNAVKRPIIRTLDILHDIQHVYGAPKKIFVEMARGDEPSKKGKRTISRKSQIQEFFNAFNQEEIRELSRQLESVEERALQSTTLYLYFTQLGKCMYTGEPIDIEKLKTNAYNIDHIYPRSKVKDDSIDNKVLVTSKANGLKGDSYPVQPDIQAKMRNTWVALHNKGLISTEKFNRLTRSTPFSQDEKWGFICRQLVETRQSTKAIAAILKERFPNSEIVYVHAGLVSEFRQEFDLPKSRSVNDLHHAKDAYLNIVVGNVYHSIFTKNWFSKVMDDSYSIKAKTLFDKPRMCGSTLVWSPDYMESTIKRFMSKNAVFLTKYAVCSHGGFYDQQPLKKRDNSSLVQRKKSLPIERYGGYDNASASFFCFVKYSLGKRTDVILMPVELLAANRFLSSLDFAHEYAQQTISKIEGKSVSVLDFPLGITAIRKGSIFSFNGFFASVAAKSNCGKAVDCRSMNTLASTPIQEKYIKHLERFAEKKKLQKELRVDPLFDHIDFQQNLSLFSFLTSKTSKKPFSVFWSNLASSFAENETSFKSLSLEEQVKALLSLVQLLKSNRSGTCDFSALGGGTQCGTSRPSSKLSNWKKFGDVRMINMSASGMFRKVSENLLDML